jgi:hypothetical protein
VSQAETRPKIPDPQKFGVVCFEGQWSSDIRDQQTVQPILELLGRTGYLRYLHRYVGSEDQLKAETRQWARKKNRRYELCYFACHGEPGTLHLTDSVAVTAETLSGWLTDRLEGRIVYFGACSVGRDTASVNKALRSFKKKTKARAVIAYTTDVDWVESAAFDLLLLSTIAWYPRSSIAWAFRYVEQNYKDLGKQLGLTTVPPAARAAS